MHPNALDQKQENWEEWFIKKGGQPFGSRQIMEWLYVHHNLNPLTYSNIALPFRQPLAFEFDWSLPKIDSILKSSDGSEKILIVTHDNRFTECVIMPSENRITLCVSCQVGCRMGCTFCQTGKMGFSRNLTSGEILAQLVLANVRLKEQGINKKVSNVVFMGMGEPLDNYEEVVQACQVMIHPKLFGLSKNRVTISTSGLVPEIQRLGQDLPVSLAISLHSADEEQRSRMMPINRKYPLAELKKVLLEYPLHTRNGITFEYVMINGQNDTEKHAKMLVKFLHGLKAKVNLIPMNPYPGNPMQASEQDQLQAFQKYLSDRSIPAPIRYSRGPDISGACGQLAAKRQEELQLHPRQIALSRRNQTRQTGRSRPS